MGQEHRNGSSCFLVLLEISCRQVNKNISDAIVLTLFIKFENFSLLVVLAEDIFFYHLYIFDSTEQFFVQSFFKTQLLYQVMCSQARELSRDPSNRRL